MKSLAGLVAFLGASYGAAALGSAFTRSALDSWYSTLRKPHWTPDGSQIGAVWSVLYTVMGVVAFVVWRQEGKTPAAATSLRWFVAQLGLNILWSGLFFGLRRPGLALIEIVALWAAILVWARTTARVSFQAALGIIPYLGWVSFAGALNAAIWRLNR